MYGVCPVLMSGMIQPEMPVVLVLEIQLWESPMLKLWVHMEHCVNKEEGLVESN